MLTERQIRHSAHHLTHSSCVCPNLLPFSFKLATHLASLTALQIICFQTTLYFIIDDNFSDVCKQPFAYRCWMFARKNGIA